jgi:hypothetical protein
VEEQQREKSMVCNTESLRDSPHFSSRILVIDKLAMINQENTPIVDDKTPKTFSKACMELDEMQKHSTSEVQIVPVPNLATEHQDYEE